MHLHNDSKLKLSQDTSSSIRRASSNPTAANFDAQ